MEVAWLGHATADIRLSGRRFITDPILRDRVGHLIRHHGSSTLESGPVDAVLISHLHHDHLDLASLRQFGADVTMIVPRGAGRLIERAATGEIIELGVDDDISIGPVRITAVPAAHKTTRTFSRRRAEPLGYVLRGDDETVYFPGDTDLHPAMADLPAPDLALLPIWGWGPTIGPGHLDPARAADAAGLLRARAVLPVHWGTFAPLTPRGVWPNRRPPRWLDQPAQRFAVEMQRRAPDSALYIPRPGSAALDPDMLGERTAQLLEQLRS